MAGLHSGDDQGTNFDMKAEVWVNNLLVATAEDTCIKGVTRNPDLSLEIVRPLPIIQTAWGDSDVTLKLFARVGTPQDTCGGHSGATGLRLYFDSAIRDSRFDMTFKPGT